MMNSTLLSARASSSLASLLRATSTETSRRRIESARQVAYRDIEGSKERCQTLAGFIREAWHVLEPANPYVHGWHIDAICEHLEAVSRGEILRLLINVPPGMMKSLAVCVLWPCWEWGPVNRPHLRTLATAYRGDLTERDNIRARRLLISDWFQLRWGEQFKLISESADKFENDKTGFRAAYPFGALTGERGDRVVIDDPMSVAQSKSDTIRKGINETFCEAIPNRMVDPVKSVIVMIMQRLHEQDPAGVALAKDLGYVHLMLPMELERERTCYSIVKPKHFDAGPPVKARYDAEKQIWYREGAEIPATRREYAEPKPLQTVYRQDKRTREGDLIFPERFPRETVERDKVSLGSYGHAGQNQQRPVPRGGALFRREWFRIVEAAPAGARKVRAWDLADSELDNAAYTSGVRMSEFGGHYYIEHVTRFRSSRKDDMIRNTAEQDGKAVRIRLPQDPGQAGKGQARYIISLLAGSLVRALPVSGDKVVRAEPFANQAEAGNVSLVRGPWNDAFLDEAEVFPASTYKDQIDAAADAFNELVATAGSKIPFARPIVVTGPRPGV